MQKIENSSAYELLDSGNGQKLERFGSVILARPAAQAVWKPQQPIDLWKQAHARFTRDQANQWICSSPLPSSWVVSVDDLLFKLSTTDFGHLGIFPEQKMFWRWMREKIRAANRPTQILNLFAYSGGVTLAAAKEGASVCHLDASRPMVSWARENAVLNQLENAPIRWIVDDVMKFLTREYKRNRRYDAIILDPPTFGRGPDGEIFKIEEQINPLLEMCRSLLTDDPLFFAFSCHTPGFSPVIMQHLVEQTMQGYQGIIQTGELLLESTNDQTFALPSGTYAWWSK